MGEEILKQWTAAGGEVGPSRSSDAKSMPKYALFGPFWLIKMTISPYGYGSIPINTIFRGMNIHKSQLQGYQGFDTLPYFPYLCHDS